MDYSTTWYYFVLKHLSHSLESALMPRLPNQSVLSRIFAGLAALSLTVILTGCSNDDDAELGETVDASEADSAEYIPASADGPAQNVPEPNLPAVATENTEEGAEATLKYFWEAFDYARLTGETDPLQLVSSDDCHFCKSFFDDWTEAYEDGHWAATYGEVEVKISDTWLGHDEEKTLPAADVTFSVSDSVVELYNSDGQLEQESEATTKETEWFAVLTYDSTAQRWQVEWIGLEELVEWDNE